MTPSRRGRAGFVVCRRVQRVLTLCFGLTVAATAAQADNGRRSYTTPLVVPDRLPSGWTVGCDFERVYQVPRCFAAAPDLSGRRAAFEVYFLGAQGPFFMAGTHSRPGATPAIVFDDDLSAFEIADDGGLTALSPQPALAVRMQTSVRARVVYFDYQHGRRELIVSTRGFEDAWGALQGLVRQQVR